jgi:hypothetical protein
LGGFENGRKEGKKKRVDGRKGGGKEERNENKMVWWANKGKWEAKKR